MNRRPFVVNDLLTKAYNVRKSSLYRLLMDAAVSLTTLQTVCGRLNLAQILSIDGMQNSL